MRWFLPVNIRKKFLDKTGKRITEKAKQEIIKIVAHPIVSKLIDKKTKFYVNETGKFVVGGPQSDTGVTTGRKIIVDTIGVTTWWWWCCFLTGVELFLVKIPPRWTVPLRIWPVIFVRTSSWRPAWLRNGMLQVGYAIGHPQPVSVMVETYGTGRISEQHLVTLIRASILICLHAGSFSTLDLRRPIYLKTAS